MNKKITPYLYILFLACFSHGIFSQGLTLKLASKDSLEITILKTISHKEKHMFEKSIYDEIYAVHEKIKRLGFFTSTIERITHTNKNYLAVFNLGSKTDEISITLPKGLNFNNPHLTGNFVKLKVGELENFTNLVVSELDNQGLSFSKISFKNPKYINQTLVVELQINQSEKRNINKVIVKGYENFPDSYLKNYFRINKSVTFSKKQLKQISSQTKTLSFIKEKKSPEILFKKDSTILYLFLDKLKTNSIDGIINFISKENGNGILLNGNLDLKLNNTFDTGESFDLFWNKIAEEKSEFKLKGDIPYLFNSHLSIGFAFNIYRQDSTFLNTKFNTNFNYQLNSKSKFSIYYSTEKSDYLINNNDTNFDSFSNNFLGIGYNLTLSSSSNLYLTKFKLYISPALGKRKSELNNTNQFKIDFNSMVNIKTSIKSYLHLRNKTGYLNSNIMLTNDLYRIGGVNSIRGFSEQSIFTSKFSYFNLDYRYLTSETSYLYSISDFGIIKSLNSSYESILGLGIGHLFTVKNSQINLAYVIGKNAINNFNFNNSQLNISFKSYF